MSDITDEDMKDPWFLLGLTALMLGVALWILMPFALHTREPFPDRGALQTSQGTLVSLDGGGRRPAYRLRLSDSERWYGSPAVGPRVKDAIRDLRGTPLITVLHAIEPSEPPANDAHWNVAAYAVTIGDRDVVTYESARAAYDEQETAEFGVGVFCAVVGSLFAYWAYTAHRDRQARPGKI